MNELMDVIVINHFTYIHSLCTYIYMCVCIVLLGHITMFMLKTQARIVGRLCAVQDIFGGDSNKMLKYMKACGCLLDAGRVERSCLAQMGKQTYPPLRTCESLPWCMEDIPIHKLWVIQIPNKSMSFPLWVINNLGIKVLPCDEGWSLVRDWLL